MIFPKKHQVMREGKKPEDLVVNVVNLIDVMIILVVFLIMSNAVSTFSSFNSPDLIMPKSRAEDPMSYETEVAVTEKAVYMDGELVEPTFKDYEDKDVPLLPGLDQALRRKLEKIASAPGAPPAYDPVTGLPTPGHLVTIKAHKGILFKQLQKVMYTCNQAGFDKIEFAVVKEGS